MMGRKKERKTFQIELSAYFTGSKDDDDDDYFDSQTSKGEAKLFQRSKPGMLYYLCGQDGALRCAEGG